MKFDLKIKTGKFNIMTKIYSLLLKEKNWFVFNFYL